MNRTIVSGAVATAVIAVAACSTPTIHGSGPSSSSFSTLPAPANTSPAESAIFAAQRFGAKGMNAAAAHAALADGRPVLVGLPDGGNDRCHSALLVPGDPKVWILNSSSTPTDGAALAREQNQYGCDSGMVLPNQVPNAPQPMPPLDEATQAKAKAEGVPFLYGMPSGPEPACHTAVVLPSGVTWILNRSGGASVAGDALDRTLKEYGCTGRGTTEGGVR